MKRVMVILFMIVAAIALLSSAASSSESDSTGMLGPEGSAFFSPGTDTKKAENKMTEALARLDSWVKARAEEKGEQLNIKPNDASSSNDLPGNLALNNSILNDSNSSNKAQENFSTNNININSSLDNSSLTNSSAGPQNVGSSSNGNFKGFYGMTASRHEIGKSGIDSHMFLSGTFEMEKSVKFQDQGID